MPHTNQLGLGKRCWNLEDLFSGSWFRLRPYSLSSTSPAIIIIITIHHHHHHHSLSSLSSFVIIILTFKLVLMAQRLACPGLKIGRSRFKSHPRLTFQSWSNYQLNQLGSKAASDSTLKQLTTCGVSNTCTFLLLFYNLILKTSAFFHAKLGWNKE